MSLFDDRTCELGEGPIWHPLRARYFWFDILNRRLLSRDDSGPLEWRFDRMVSAAGWVDADRMIMATETGLAVLDLRDGALVPLVAVEAEDRATRSNDGRADRQGGFWFGTMGKRAEPGSGAIYRYYRGAVRQVVAGVTIPNAICFVPDGRAAFYADTAAGRIWRQPLDAEGWPAGDPAPFLDLSAQGLNPDGAVIDAEGGLWCALWGAGRVTRFDMAGRATDHLDLPGRHSSCPAFGGPDLRDMLVTTAREGIAAPDPAQGCTYLLRAPVAGLAEPRVIL
ncbi:SMP-30/gluconolactonase/LRE family protein [Gemmobacter lutimaris]|uniref:SMP-30/gluconolactonase/LRE family protein n=1 Tax=Gemmobacter lutimaris TaxID=2306023 RepID=A0A398BHQ4_9RHOB|nr:SMP-30/gluconolactonase/LRE family protein [Gemmobacter lutimaris]RID90059.1 SMP-30/gluconolactonase/LRE family protein [Gemmobacter lutimaris]